MKKIVVMVALCLLSIAVFAQMGTTLRLKDAIALYADDETLTYDGDSVIDVIDDLVAEGIDARTSNPDPEGGYDYSYYRDYTPLMYASMSGYTEIVKSLIASGADVDAEGGYVVYTSLLLAVGNGHTETVKLLIDTGANLEARQSDPDMYFSSDGYPTAIMKAARGNRIEILKALIAGGADIDATSAKNYSALMYAAIDGRTEIVKILIDAGAELEIESGTVEGYGRKTALLYAVSEGHIEVIKLLLEAGANLEAQATSGYTALLMALQSGNAAALKILMDAGANIDPQSDSSSYETSSANVALLRAAQQGHIEVVNMIKEAGGDKKARESLEELIEEGIDATTDDNDYTPLMLAALYGYADIAKSLIADGANLEAKNRDSSWASSDLFTALILAAKAGQTEVMKILIDAGANLDATGNDGETALTLAASNGKLEAIKILIDEGANLEISADHGGTALSEAAIRGQIEAVKILLEAGANIEAQGENEKTALIWAAEHGHAEVVEILAKEGANLEAQSGYGSALHLAARYGHAEVISALAKAGVHLDGNDFFEAVTENEIEAVQAFLKAGVDSNTRNSRGYTALISAAFRGYTDIIQVVIEAGADIEAKTTHGDTALLGAVKNGHIGALTALIDAGVNIEATSNLGEFALMEAAMEGHAGIVKILIDAGANIYAKDDDRTALDRADWYDHTDIVDILTEASQAVIRGTGHNYYKVPYVGETSVLTEVASDVQNRIIKKHSIPTTINDFLDDGSSITGKLGTIYREHILNEDDDAILTMYRFMYTLSNRNSNGMTKLSFIDGEGTERQAYGQAIYILNRGNIKTELFSRDIYFGHQDLSSSNTLSGVIGNNTYFKAIDDSIISVRYTLQSSSTQTADSHTAILYRNEIENILDKTVFCQVEASLPLIDKNNPYRYTIQNALDSTPATSYVENTNDDLMTISFDFTKNYTFTDIAIINGYAQNESLYYDNNRCKRIIVTDATTDYEHTYKFDGTTLKHQNFTFEDSIRQSSVTIDVTEIYAGTKYSDTSLAELDMYIEGDGWLFGFE